MSIFFQFPHLEVPGDFQLQLLCKPRAMKLASIAEVQPKVKNFNS